MRSALPAVTTERLCPQAICVPPDFSRYKAASRATREILQCHTDIIEPLSLDEAYLDVTIEQDRSAHRNQSCDCDSPADSRRAFSHRIGGGRSEQVPGKDRLRLAQARRSPRHPTEGLRYLSATASRCPHPGCWPSYRGSPEADWHSDRRRVALVRTGCHFGWPAPFLSNGNSTFSSLPRPTSRRAEGLGTDFSQETEFPYILSKLGI